MSHVQVLCLLADLFIFRTIAEFTQVRGRTIIPRLTSFPLPPIVLQSSKSALPPKHFGRITTKLNLFSMKPSFQYRLYIFLFVHMFISVHMFIC